MFVALVLAAATPALSCPSGSTESECSAADIAARIALTHKRVALIATRCLYDYGGKCRVEASGRINVAERGTTLLWQKLELAPRDGPEARMIVLLAQDKAGKISLAGFAESTGSLGAPDLVANGDTQSLVHVTGTLAGSGGGNADALFAGDGAAAKWRRIDLSDWSDQGAKMMPKGYWLRGPASFAFDEMFASSPVAREGDGHCCPRGGNAFFDLDIRGDRLVLTRMRFEPMQLATREMVDIVAGVPDD